MMKSDSRSADRSRRVMKSRLIASLTIVLIVTAPQLQSSNPPYTKSATQKLLQQGTQAFGHHDYVMARKYFDAAVASDPKSWAPYLGRGCVSIRERKWSQAREDMDMVVRLKPSHFVAAMFRADMEERLGHHQQALDELDHLVKITAADFPRNCALAYNGHAWVLATCPSASFRSANQAISEAKRACELSSWRSSACIDTLAAAYAEAGDWDSAIRFQQEAISRIDKETRAIKNAEQRSSVSEKTAAAYQRHLAAYRRHQAWRLNPDEPILVEIR